MSALTPERLAEIERRAEAATDDFGLQFRVPAGEWLLTADKPTMQLMRHARTDVTDLLAEVERLRGSVDDAVDYCNDMAHDYEAGYVACAVLALLNPPTEGETDHE